MTTEENRRIFANNLRKLLDERGLQAKDLIEVTGASQASISEWLNARKYPRIDKIERLANFFKVKKSDLIEDPTQTEAERKIKELTRKFNLLADAEKQQALDYLDFLATQSKKGQKRPSPQASTSEPTD